MVLHSILPSRQRYVKMRQSLVRFRSVIHMHVTQKQYMKVHKYLDQV